MTYDTRNRMLHIKDDKQVKLSKIEERLLVCLSRNVAVSYEEINEYVKGTNLSRTMKSLNEKGLKIERLRGYGLRLVNEIYFE